MSPAIPGEAGRWVFFSFFLSSATAVACSVTFPVTIWIYRPFVCLERARILTCIVNWKTVVYWSTPNLRNVSFTFSFLLDTDWCFLLSTQPRRFWSAAIFWHSPGTCLFLLFYNHNMMLVKLDSIAPSYWCYWWTGWRCTNAQVLWKKKKKKLQTITIDLRLFRLLPFIIVFQTDLFVVFVWELPVAQFAWLVYRKRCECTNQVKMSRITSNVLSAVGELFFFNSLPPQ